MITTDLLRMIFSFLLVCFFAVSGCGIRSPVYDVRVNFQTKNKEEVAKALRDPDPFVRAEAVKYIIKLRECTQRVYERARDVDATVRVSLATNLEFCNTEESKKTLVLMIRDDSAIVRKAIPNSLIRNDFCRGECLFDMRKLLDDRDPFVKLSAAKVLYKRFPQESHSAVIDCLSSRIFLVKEEAVKALPLFKTTDDIYYLSEFLEAGDESLRISSRKAIEQILGRALTGAEFAKVIRKEPLSLSTETASLPKNFYSKEKARNELKEDAPLLPALGIGKNNMIDKDAIAVIIGNRDYSSVDIPNVDYALRDARLMKEVALDVFGVPEENIIYMENAKTSDFNKIFGTPGEKDGLLASWAKPSSKIYVYYSGHGAPNLETKDAYFVPVNSDVNYIKLSGYPLKQLYRNLENLKVSSVTVILDACFSGVTQAGSIIKSASPVFVSASSEYDLAKSSITILSSSKADEISSWDKNNRFGLFTYYLVKGLKEADTNHEGMITIGKLKKYLAKKVPYQAWKLMNRDQHPQIIGAEQKILIRWEK